MKIVPVLFFGFGWKADRHAQTDRCQCFSPGPHLQFLDEVTSLQVQVDKLRTLGINKIIALGHSGFTVDQMIAKKVRGVDVVIGGHTNTFLYTGRKADKAVTSATSVTYTVGLTLLLKAQAVFNDLNWSVGYLMHLNKVYFACFYVSFFK